MHTNIFLGIIFKNIRIVGGGRGGGGYYYFLSNYAKGNVVFSPNLTYRHYISKLIWLHRTKIVWSFDFPVQNPSD